MVLGSVIRCLPCFGHLAHSPQGLTAPGAEWDLQGEALMVVAIPPVWPLALTSFHPSTNSEIRSYSELHFAGEKTEISNSSVSLLGGRARESPGPTVHRPAIGLWERMWALGLRLARLWRDEQSWPHKESDNMDPLSVVPFCTMQILNTLLYTYILNPLEVPYTQCQMSWKVKFVYRKCHSDEVCFLKS